MEIENSLFQAYIKDISGVETESDRQEMIVDFLKDQLGKPYSYGVNSASTGDRVFDCSSLVQEAYRRIGLELARTTVNQATYFGRVVELDEPLQAGDLLYFTGEYGYYNPQFPMGVGHVATYVGDNKVIHTVAWFDEHGEESGEVIEESLEDALKRRADMTGRENDLVVVKRVFEGEQYYHEGRAKPLPQNS